ncbi:MAG: polysaccharide deacetylase family protein, partial [Gammaproteobacteria bacterium]|nr:polysaccharide deacetylase family protein [Gammaproteobacteria bacterium]
MSRIMDEESSYDDVRKSLKKIAEKSLINEVTTEYHTESQSKSIDDEETAERDIAGRQQQLNLPDPRNNPRFEVTGRDWPTEDLSPSICMWHDDKLAAFSVSIDDNHVDDHAFWLELAANYGWRWTWFVITNKIGDGSDDWPQWQNLINLGHEIQSHTCTHLCDGLFNIQKEYQVSQSQINSHLNANKAVALAYPFGYKTRKDGSPCASIPTKNNRQEA